MYSISLDIYIIWFHFPYERNIACNLNPCKSAPSLYGEKETYVGNKTFESSTHQYKLYSYLNQPFSLKELCKEV